MSFHEPFYAAIAAMLEEKSKSAAVDCCVPASDYVDQLRRDQVDCASASEINLLDSILARAIELSIRDSDNFDVYVFILSKRIPEQYIYTLVVILSAPIPCSVNSYRQVLIAIENLYNYCLYDSPVSRPLFIALLGMINSHEIATAYSTFPEHDSDLLDRVLHKSTTL